MYADFKVSEQKIGEGGIPQWDFSLDKGGLSLVTGKEGAFQRACVAAFLIYGTFKFLPLAGIQWSLLISPPSEIDRLDIDDITQQILNSFNEQEVPNYFPIFTEENRGGQRFLRVSITDGQNLAQSRDSI